MNGLAFLYIWLIATKDSLKIIALVTLPIEGEGWGEGLLISPPRYR